MAADEQLCKVCREPMRSGAIKCTSCNAYQDWTRHLMRWSTFGTAVLALVPLWGIAISLRSAFSAPAAKVEALVTACSATEMRIALVNAGDLDAIVTGHEFSLQRGGINEPLAYTVRSNAEDTPLVHAGASATMVSYAPYVGNEPTRFVPRGESVEQCEYRLSISWKDFSDASHQIERSCVCHA